MQINHETIGTRLPRVVEQQDAVVLREAMPGVVRIRCGRHVVSLTSSEARRAVAMLDEIAEQDAVARRARAAANAR